MFPKTCICDKFGFLPHHVYEGVKPGSVWLAKLYTTIWTTSTQSDRSILSACNMERTISTIVWLSSSTPFCSSVYGVIRSWWIHVRQDALEMQCS